MSADEIDWSSIPFELTETDRENLLLGDEHFKPHTWDELKHIIGKEHLDSFVALILAMSDLDLCDFSHQRPLDSQT